MRMYHSGEYTSYLTLFCLNPQVPADKCWTWAAGFFERRIDWFLTFDDPSLTKATPGRGTSCQDQNTRRISPPPPAPPPKEVIFILNRQLAFKVFFVSVFIFTTVLSHWNFSRRKFRLLSPGKASCNRVALPNLQCMPGVTWTSGS